MTPDEQFETDLRLKPQKAASPDDHPRLDLSVTRTGDVETVSGKELMIQAIRNRLATRQGELAELGHPEYGSLLDTVIGAPNTEETRRLIEILVRDSLKNEPRIDRVLRVEAKADALHNDCVNVSVTIGLTGSREILSAVYPFYLED